MRIKLIGKIEHLQVGLNELKSTIGFELDESGFPINVEQSSAIIVSKEKEVGLIQYVNTVDFFRSLHQWIDLCKNKEVFYLEETPQFKTIGCMVDVSRNAVLQVKEIKDLIINMAKLGLNTLMLYTEDTYEVKDLPYFGYMRGRYTENELKECDDFANKFGIEIIPCIQTLAHLKHALKWNYAQEIRDTADILLVGEKKTYEFIRKLIESASKPFRSNKIHIGMDEAVQLGLGKYLEKNGYKKRFDIMNEHLNKVVKITKELNLHPMIWSDMYFMLGSKENRYYDLDAQIPKDIIEDIPDVQLVYWDYYHTEEDFYETFIEKHLELKKDIAFAGGAWTWNGISPNYSKAIKTTETALKVCKQKGIKDVFLTLWGDNGAETPYNTALLMLQVIAEHSYHKIPEQSYIKNRFKSVFKTDFDEMYLLNKLDEIPGVSDGNYHESNPSKFILWQDVLIGLYDENIKGYPIQEHYENLHDELSRCSTNDNNISLLFNFYSQLAKVLAIKTNVGINIKDIYDKDLKEEMKEQIKITENLIYEVRQLHEKHRELWFELYKPFGWEIIDLRYGGLIQRLSTAMYRLECWVLGKTDSISELEEERLFFEGPYRMPKGSLGRNLYNRIVSASDN